MLPYVKCLFQQMTYLLPTCHLWFHKFIFFFPANIYLWIFWLTLVLKASFISILQISILILYNYFLTSFVLVIACVPRVTFSMTILFNFSVKAVLFVKCKKCPCKLTVVNLYPFIFTALIFEMALNYLFPWLFKLVYDIFQTPSLFLTLCEYSHVLRIPYFIVWFMC